MNAIIEQCSQYQDCKQQLCSATRQLLHSSQEKKEHKSVHWAQSLKALLHLIHLLSTFTLFPARLFSLLGSCPFLHHYDAWSRSLDSLWESSS